MIYIAIVEDTDADAQILQEHLKRYDQEHHEGFQVVRFRTAEELLSGYQPVYHLILMDIDMPGMNGMEAAQQLRLLDDTTALMFTTNLSQYAIKGYEVNALDYLLKPIDYYSFSMKLKRVLSIIRRMNTESIGVPTKDGMIKLDIAGIYYVEIITHQLIWHCEDGLYKSRGVMKDVEEKLLSHQFARCNNGYLVNLRHVTALQDDEVTVGRDVLRISRPRKKAFTQALARYMGGQDSCILFMKNTNL